MEPDWQARRLRLLGHFRYEHLPERLREISKPFAQLAHALDEMPDVNGHDIDEALGHLLRAKDAAVRAAL